ncbi:MAG: hypothetical protein JJU11_18615, partial [Candidatus Sumerlaeia bacterium]|nr:hypothetical protein [Candidatus Sumerlaeia bacterium]
HIFKGLANRDIEPELLTLYHKWLDSNTHVSKLEAYADTYRVPSGTDIWKIHPDHSFTNIDKAQLREIAINFRDKPFVEHKLKTLNARINSRKAARYVPAWWHDVITLFRFDNRPLATCDSLEKVAAFYKESFHKADRAMRNIYAEFLQHQEIVAPIQEHYENLNDELLQHWFEYFNEYKPNQQGYLPKLISESEPGTAIIVGDGIRYEIAAFVASKLKGKCEISKNTLFADMPSETEHNMSALYAGNNEVIPIHKDREKKLLEATAKDITFKHLSSLHGGINADYLVLTYKDIDTIGETLQMSAIKLFQEFEEELIKQIQLLLNMGYKQIYLVTDHGFVLTGLLDEAAKIDPSAEGKKEVHERFIRTVSPQPNKDWLKFERPYKEYRFVYAAKNHRPFKSKGVYGFAHGGFTPQEIIIPCFVFSNTAPVTEGLEVNIENKAELGDVTGEWYKIKLAACGKSKDLFSSARRVQILLYANNLSQGKSHIITMEQGMTEAFEFSFSGHNEVTAVVVDAESQKQLDSVNIKKSNARDFGGLF